MSMVRNVFVSALFGLATNACVTVAEPESQGQTHWLRQCDEDADCGELACECGVCTTRCGSGSCAIEGADAECHASNSADVVELCGGPHDAPLCLAATGNAANVDASTSEGNVTGPDGSTSEGNVSGPDGSTNEGNVSGPDGSTNEGNVSGPDGSTNEGNVSGPDGSTNEGNVSGPDGSTSEGNVSGPDASVGGD